MKILTLVLLTVILFSCEYKEEIEYRYDCTCANDTIKAKLDGFVLKCLGNPSQSVSVSGYKVKKNNIGSRAYWVAPQCLEIAKELYCPQYRYARFWKGGSTITDWVNTGCEKSLYENYLLRYKPKEIKY